VIASMSVKGSKRSTATHLPCREKNGHRHCGG